MAQMLSAWDERYAGEEYKYGTQPNAFLQENASRIRPRGRVLCLAEGEGRNAVYLAGQGYQVTGVDASETGLSKARRLAAEKGVEVTFLQRDLEEYHIQPQAWDAIVCIFCHLPPVLRRPVHRACVEGLKPGGVFILEAYRPEHLEIGTDGPPTVELMITLADLTEELSGLRFDHALECVHDFSEGEGHNGKGAVVQVIGMKK